MEIIYLLVPLSIVLLAIAVWIFFWAVDNDQFSDLGSPARSILEPEQQLSESSIDREKNDTGARDESRESVGA